MKLRRVLPAFLAMALLPVSLAAGAWAQTSAQAQSQAQTQAKAQAQALAAANNPNKMDINSASLSDLKSLPGIGDAYAQRIVKGRPYQNKAQLATRGVLPQATYDRVKLMIVAAQPK